MNSHTSERNECRLRVEDSVFGEHIFVTDFLTTWYAIYTLFDLERYHNKIARKLRNNDIPVVQLNYVQKKVLLLHTVGYKSQLNKLVPIKDWK